MPLPIGPIVAAAVRAATKKLATRATGGITGKGAKNVNPTYQQMISSKAKKQAAGYAAGAGATAAWVGTQVATHRNDPLHGTGKYITINKSRGGGSRQQKK